MSARLLSILFAGILALANGEEDVVPKQRIARMVNGNVILGKLQPKPAAAEQGNGR